MAGGSFATFQLDTNLQGSLARGSKKLLEQIYLRLQFEAPRIESEMKANAPWTDQTSNARNGLAARAYFDGDGLGIVLFHQVPYGIWLELANDSRYAIILPTLEQQGPEILRNVGAIMGETGFTS